MTCSRPCYKVPMEYKFSYFNYTYLSYLLYLKFLIYKTTLEIIILQKGNCYKPINISCGYQKCGLYNRCLRPANEMPSYNSIYQQSKEEYLTYFSLEDIFDLLI